MLTLILLGFLELGCMNALYRYDLMLKKQEFRDALRGQLIMQLDKWVKAQEAKKH
jgi:hypothetical protein